MQTLMNRWTLCTGLAIAIASSALGGCGKQPTPPSTASTDATTQATVPAPPGDSTPKAADSSTRQAVDANEKGGGSGVQSTVGTAASGAPPYTMNSAPEGNPAPSQGTKAGEPAKK